MGPFLKFSIGAHHQQLSLNKKALLDCTLCLAAFLEGHKKGKLLQRKTSMRRNCQNPSLRPACKLSSSSCCLHLSHLLLSVAALPGQNVQELRAPCCWESCPCRQGRRLWAEMCLCWSWKGCVCVFRAVLKCGGVRVVAVSHLCVSCSVEETFLNFL